MHTDQARTRPVSFITFSLIYLDIPTVNIRKILSNLWMSAEQMIYHLCHASAFRGVVMEEMLCACHGIGHQRSSLNLAGPYDYNDGATTRIIAIPASSRHKVKGPSDDFQSCSSTWLQLSN